MKIAVTFMGMEARKHSTARATISNFSARGCQSSTAPFFIIHIKSLNNMHKYTISVDYLKLYLLGGKFEDRDNIYFKRNQYSSRHYRFIETVYFFDQVIGTLEHTPFSSVLKSESSLLKIENRFLYSTELNYLLQSFFKTTGARFQNISRLDIAIDSNEFLNQYHPQQLITDYLQGKVERNGRGVFTVMGAEKNVKDYTYLRFGSRSSDVTVILYNKSLEMREVKHKDYIYQKWLQSGLDVSRDVWRLEFSLKSKAKYFVNTSSGEIQTLTLDCIFDNVFLKELAMGLSKRYFRFVDPTTATRKSRMKDITLLDTSGAVMDKINIKNNTDVTRREKILLKNMFRLSQKHSSIPPSVSDEAETIKDWLTRTPVLEDYYNKKKHDWAKEFQNPHRSK